MRNLYFGILLLLLIIISLAVGLFLHEFKIITEGYEDTTNKYVDKAKAETIARGFATGFAGSRSGSTALSRISRASRPTRTIIRTSC